MREPFFMGDVNSEQKGAKPFLKWAGGKSQLIQAINTVLPHNFLKEENVTYFEPFIGSGAIMFWLLQQYKTIKKAVINDVNSDLTKAYSIIKNEPFLLIKVLAAIQEKYYNFSEEDRQKYYLEKRHEFNTRSLSTLNNTALLIFLNRTCFNGLYRVNSKNSFNVPFGRYTRPRICDAETIIADSKVLERVTILNGDYTATLQHANKKCFFYFDPPYKPISKTSSFNAYATDNFGDKEQIRLKNFCDELTLSGYKWLLSNSDPKNTNPADDFFDELFTGPGVTIERVKAKRVINSNSSGRGEIYELLIRNYNS